MFRRLALTLLILTAFLAVTAEAQVTSCGCVCPPVTQPPTTTLPTPIFIPPVSVGPLPPIDIVGMVEGFVDVLFGEKFKKPITLGLFILALVVLILALSASSKMLKKSWKYWRRRLR